MKKEKGAAIIVALFVVALVAAMSTLMLVRISADLRRTELLQNATQAYFLAEGSVAWAKDTLITNIDKKKPNQIVDNTPIQSPENTVDNAKIQSTIYAAEGRFNINNLTKTEEDKTFLRLLRVVDPALSQQSAQQILQAVHDWISGSTNLDLENYYSKQNPPFKAPHRLMASASEIRLVKGMTQKLYEALIPYIIALPTETSINVNNADIPVLMSLSETLKPEAAKVIIQYRKNRPFNTTQEFTQFDVVKNAGVTDKKITVESNYFLVETHVRVSQQDIVLYTLLERTTKTPPTIRTIWQSKGTL